MTGIIKCPSCGMRVIPKSDGTCPNCRTAIDEAAPVPVAVTTPIPTAPAHAPVQPPPLHEPFTSQVITENNNAPRRYKLIVHALSILGPALLWALVVGRVAAQELVSDPEFSSAALTNSGALVVGYLHFALAILVLSLAYALAGGLEWKAQRLHIARVGIYIVLTGIFPGLILVSLWLFIRSVLGSIFRLKGLAAVGGLFRVNEII
jgi:hypothetical protein